MDQILKTAGLQSFDHSEQQTSTDTKQQIAGHGPCNHITINNLLTPQ